MNNLISFGCSFTFGDELDDLPDWYEDMEDERNFMPHKLKYHKPSKKSYPYILGSFLDFDVENNGWRGGSNDRIFRTFFDHVLNNKKNSIYVIQWTFPDRTEFWSNKKQFYVGVVPTLIDKDEYTKEHYLNYHDENDVLSRLVRYIWSVDAICEKNNHKLLQFMPIENNLNGLSDTILNTDEIMKIVDYQVHPTEEGHKKLAEYLTREINEE